MSSPHESPRSASSDPDQSDIEQALQDAETTLAAIKKRYADVQAAQLRQQELKVQINRTQSELRRHRTAELRHELKKLQNALEETELVLESQLFSWSSFKEPFWQAVRFGGIGIVIGWILKSLAG
jgi:peptidoglycan hydrolase CwlO-like protein